MSRSATETTLLWLFVINLGIAFGAGLYEHRIVVPRWIDSSAGTGTHWNAEAARRDDTGRRFWAFVTTLPLTLTFQKRIINSRGTNTTSATTAQRIGASKRCGLKENRPPGEMPVLHRHSLASLGGSECIQLVRMSQCQPT